MNKPKIGDKYIIEIDSHMTNKKGDLYGVKGFNSLVFDQNGLDKLAPPETAAMYVMGFTDAEKEYRKRDDTEYQRGLNDAWDAAMKLVLEPNQGGYSFEELDACFGKERDGSYTLLKDYTVEEAVKKIREYEEQNAKEDAEIKVGDEVKAEDNVVGVAIRINGNFVSVIRTNDERGYVEYLCNKDGLTKTGRHVDLSELFGGEDA